MFFFYEQNRYKNLYFTEVRYEECFYFNIILNVAKDLLIHFRQSFKA